jgi:hypothetical protein
MPGNDVVDLLDVDARPETFHRRFDARVFTEQERRIIAQSTNSQARRWAHWAAKEAAYKLLRQRDPKFVFSPIRLVAQFEETTSDAGVASAWEIGVGRAADLGSRAPGAGSSSQRPVLRRGRVELAAGSAPGLGGIELRSFEAPDFVHVVALPAGSDWDDLVTAVEPLAEGAADPSLAVRRLALRAIARELGVEISRLAIGRRERIPTVEVDGQTTSFALSFSHHGRYVAYAMTPRGRGSSFAGRESAARDEGGAAERNVAQAAGAVGSPGRRADAERKMGCGK